MLLLLEVRVRVKVRYWAELEAFWTGTTSSFTFASKEYRTQRCSSLKGTFETKKHFPKEVLHQKWCSEQESNLHGRNGYQILSLMRVTNSAT